MKKIIKLSIIPFLSIGFITTSCSLFENDKLERKDWDFSKLSDMTIKNIKSESVQLRTYNNSQSHQKDLFNKVILPSLKNTKNEQEFLKEFKKYFKIGLIATRPHQGWDMKDSGGGYYHYHSETTNDIFKPVTLIQDFQLNFLTQNGSRFDYYSEGIPIVMDYPNKEKIRVQNIDVSKISILYNNKPLSKEVHTINNIVIKSSNDETGEIVLTASYKNYLTDPDKTVTKEFKIRGFQTKSDFENNKNHKIVQPTYSVNKNAKEFLIFYVEIASYVVDFAIKNAKLPLYFYRGRLVVSF